MTRGTSHRTKNLTASAILAAMGVSLLFIGMMIETLDLSMAALASFLCIFAVIELGGKYSWLIYAVTGVLSVILMPFNMAGWFYLLFFGYYPILKERFERLNKTLAWAVKLIVVNLALTACITLASFLFYSGNMLKALKVMLGAENWGVYAIIGMWVLVNIVFIIYDIALTRLITFYFIKIRHRFKFLK